MRSSDRKIILGKLGKPHGLKGFIYIRFYGDDPKSLLNFSQIYSEDSSLGKVDKIAELKDRVTIHISGINTRNSAETLRDKEIYVREDQLPKLDNGEAYFYQLENLIVKNKQDRKGRKLGESFEANFNFRQVVIVFDLLLLSVLNF